MAGKFMFEDPMKSGRVTSRYENKDAGVISSNPPAPPTRGGGPQGGGTADQNQPLGGGGANPFAGVNPPVTKPPVDRGNPFEVGGGAPVRSPGPAPTLAPPTLKPPPVFDAKALLPNPAGTPSPVFDPKAGLPSSGADGRFTPDARIMQQLTGAHPDLNWAHFEPMLQKYMTLLQSSTPPAPYVPPPTVGRSPSPYGPPTAPTPGAPYGTPPSTPAYGTPPPTPGAPYVPPAPPISMPPSPYYPPPSAPPAPYSAPPTGRPLGRR